MKTWQKLVLALSTILLVISLVVFVGTFVIHRLVGDKEQTKRWLDESGVYSSLSTSIKNQFSQDNATISPASNAIVNKSIDRTINEQKVQQVVEDNLNNTYAWLEGEAESLQINIGAEELQTEFANNVVGELRILARSLPTCSRNNPPISTDITTINCIPPGYPVETEIEKIRASIVSGDIGQLSREFNTQDPAINTSQGQQSISQTLAPIKSSYRLSKQLQIVAAAVLIICTVVIIVLSKPHYKALRIFAAILLPYGAIYIIAGFSVPALINGGLGAMLDQSASNIFAEPVEKITQNISVLVGTLLFRAGVIMLIMGIVLLISYMLIKRVVNKKVIETPVPPTPMNTGLNQNL